MKDHLLPIFAMIGTVVATLTMLVFCMAMGANAKPEEIQSLKQWMLGLSLLAVVGIAVGIALMRNAQPGWAAAVSILPAILMGIVLLIALLK